MLTGKSFRLKQDTIAIENIDGKRTAVSLPPGAIIHVISGPSETDSRMVGVNWLSRTLVMFAVDVQARGEEVRGATD